MVPFYYNFAILMYFVFITIFLVNIESLGSVTEIGNGNNLFAKSIELLSIFHRKNWRNQTNITISC